MQNAQKYGAAPRKQPPITDFARPRSRPETPSPSAVYPLYVGIPDEAPAFGEGGMATNVGLSAGGTSGTRGVDVVLRDFTVAQLFAANNYNKVRAVVHLGEEDAEKLIGIYKQVLASAATKWAGLSVNLRNPVGEGGRMEIGFPMRRNDDGNKVPKLVMAYYNNPDVPNEPASVDRVNDLLRSLHAQGIEGEFNLWAMQDRNDATRVNAGFYFTTKSLTF